MTASGSKEFRGWSSQVDLLMDMDPWTSAQSGQALFLEMILLENYLLELWAIGGAGWGSKQMDRDVYVHEEKYSVALCGHVLYYESS